MKFMLMSIWILIMSQIDFEKATLVQLIWTTVSFIFIIAGYWIKDNKGE